MAALRTPLYDWHVSHGARMIEFGGWEMPLQFRGIVEEHLAVRSAAGLFDVSHMGKLLLMGSGAHEAIARLSTNDIPATPGRARYTHLLDDEGRIIDDVIFTCLASDRFLCVCNAGPRRRVVSWINDHLLGRELRDLTPDLLCLALQGPKAPGILSR
ncbi:MAG: glycine cleavage system aminomethyltransferase GcvT, partial [Candidatus Thermoplasmatota archaeon]